MLQHLLMLFLQRLGCTVTWIYAGEQKDHVKALMKSSKANMALMFSEQGNYFELYDNHSNIYQGTNFEEVDIPDLLLVGRKYLPNVFEIRRMLPFVLYAG